MKNEEKIKIILEMLESSLLAENVQKAIKKNLKNYDDDILDWILGSLSRERVAGEELSTELMRFDADQQARWDNLAKNQMQTADQFIEEAFKELTKEV